MHPQLSPPRQDKPVFIRQYQNSIESRRDIITCTTQADLNLRSHARQFERKRSA